MATTTTNAATTFGSDIEKFLAGSKQAARALPHMVVELVTAHRVSVDGNPLIVPGDDDSDNPAEHGIYYADLRNWISKPEDMDADMHKKMVSRIKARMLAASDRGAKLLADIAEGAKDVKDAKATAKRDPSNLSCIARVQQADAALKADTTLRSAVNKAIERAVFAYVYIVEDESRACFNTIHMPATGSVARYTQANVDPKTGEMIHTETSVPLAKYAENVRAKMIEWSLGEDERAAFLEAQREENGETAERAPHHNESEGTKALNLVASQSGGELLILSRAASIAARFDNETAPQGEMRQEMIALYSALRSAITVEQVEAWERKNVS